MRPIYDPTILRRSNFLFAILAVFCVAPFAAAQQPTPATESAGSELSEQLLKATGKASGNKHLLKYKFQPNESLFYEVVHQTAVDTTVDGNTQKMKSRSKSLKKWEFSAVDAEGSATFVHSVDYVDMWSETDGRSPVHYDSRTGEEPPADYESLAESIGKPISTVKASVHGKIVDRSDSVKQIDRGTGGLLIPLPPRAVPVGTEWALPSSVKVTLSDGRQQSIKTRVKYVLEKVETGIATISVTTQVLTPVSEARVKSQLIQKLSSGIVKFDMDAGQMVSKQLDWDESVIGFNGPESNMSFLAQMTERLVPAAEVASLRQPAK